MRIAIALIAIAGLGLTACDGTSDRVVGQAPGMDDPGMEDPGVDDPMQDDGPVATPPPQELAAFVGDECRQSPEARDAAPLGDTGFDTGATPEDASPAGSGFAADCL